MKVRTQSLLRKALLFSGAIFIGWAAQAQSTGSNSSSDTSRRAQMHRAWANRKAGDSLSGKDGFRRRDNHIRYTPEQRKQAMAINKEYHKRAADLFMKDNSTLKEYKAGLVSLQKEKKDKLKALLTPAQNEQVARHKKQASENAQVMAAARMERLKIHLSLTDDQVAKIKSGQEELKSKFKTIHENDNLLPQQKMEQMKDLMAKRKDVYKSVLTPEQFSKFEQMSQRRHGRGGERGERHPFGENMPEGGRENAI